MPEEGIETSDLKESLDAQREHAEHAQHAQHGGGDHGDHATKMPGWITLLSLSTAIIAALAAVASLYSGSLANESIVEKNEAVLQMSAAGDQWAQYQAAHIKAYLYITQAELMPANKQDEFRKKGEDEIRKALTPKAAALEHERKRDESNVASETFLHQHHLFARAVTVFQVAIALAAIAALTRRKALWFVSLGGGILGIFFFIQGFRAERTPARSAEEIHAAPAPSNAPHPHGE